MHPIEIREQNANLLEEVKDLLFASQCLMRAVTNENPPANIGHAKSKIYAVAQRLTGIAMRLDDQEDAAAKPPPVATVDGGWTRPRAPAPAASSRPAPPKAATKKKAHKL